ncbi:hypothetical protein FE782_10830 [Paenibacillus antri]|uniref:Uncharacterized protein n=1 Tax=Paenibacillus antri TaxID=2582848 RepID=A0A5R9G7Q5_9BACL|nr:hypothetical protein [Paenibacillus antri]TLS52452.1 hypothetical protein FE782_10830 [Paenibacillus antri]
MDQTKYSKQSEAGNTITYRALGGGVPVPVSVTSYGDRKEVMIKGENYRIRSMQGEGNSRLSITYPSGKTYTAERFTGMYMVYDEQGEWVTPATRYIDDTRILTPGEEYYLANDLIRAAYEEQHTTNGNLFYFNLYVENLEPTDFYLFMAKIGACLVMGAPVFLFIKSL